MRALKSSFASTRSFDAWSANAESSAAAAKMRVFGVMGRRPYHTEKHRSIRARRSEPAIEEAIEPAAATALSVAIRAIARPVGIVPAHEPAALGAGRARLGAFDEELHFPSRAAGQRDRSTLGIDLDALHARRRRKFARDRTTRRVLQESQPNGDGESRSRQLHVARIVEAAPHRGDEIGREADEPRVLRVVARARLAGDRSSDARG